MSERTMRAVTHPEPRLGVAGFDCTACNTDSDIIAYESGQWACWRCGFPVGDETAERIDEILRSSTLELGETDG